MTMPGCRARSARPSANAAPPSSPPAALSSAASAANALVDHVRSLVTPGAIHSIAVKSNGLYGFDANVWAGMPVRTTTPGSYEVITGYDLSDAFSQQKLAATNKELVEERAFVADMIK
jgi:malate dehydrogenase